MTLLMASERIICYFMLIVQERGLIARRQSFRSEKLKVKELVETARELW